MIEKNSDSLGLGQSQSLISESQNSGSSANKQQINDYVHKFREEVKLKFTTSITNHNFKFPRIEKLINPKNSFVEKSNSSLENVQVYDLVSENVKNSLKLKFENKRNSETEFLVDAISSVGKLNKEYLHSQFKKPDSELIKYIYRSLKIKFQKKRSQNSEFAVLEKGKSKKPVRSTSKVNISATPTTDLESMTRFKSSKIIVLKQALQNPSTSSGIRKYLVSDRPKLNNSSNINLDKSLANSNLVTKLKISFGKTPSSSFMKSKLNDLLRMKSTIAPKRTNSSQRSEYNSLLKICPQKAKGICKSNRNISSQSNEKINNFPNFYLNPKYDTKLAAMTMSKQQLENYAQKMTQKKTSKSKKKPEKDINGLEFQENRGFGKGIIEPGLREKIKNSFLKKKLTKISHF